MSLLQQILDHKIVAILRGLQPGNVLPIIYALQEGGIHFVEITLNSPGALKQIEECRAKLEGKMMIGAGTVLNVEDATNSIKAGAQFLISPNTDSSVITVTKEHGLVSIPGAFTATEVLLANQYGADIIKIFPAPSPRYIRDILAPLDFVKLMPTGGVNQDNILQYQEAGAVAFGIGSSLVSSDQKVDAASLQLLTKKAQSLVHALERKI